MACRGGHRHQRRGGSPCGSHRGPLTGSRRGACAPFEQEASFDIQAVESFTPADTEIDGPDLADVIVAAGESLPPMRFDCGVDDLLIEPNRTLHRRLTAAGVSHDYVEYPGGHAWAYWRRHLPQTLRHISDAATRSR